MSPIIKKLFYAFFLIPVPFWSQDFFEVDFIKTMNLKYRFEALLVFKAKIFDLAEYSVQYDPINLRHITHLNAVVPYGFSQGFPYTVLESAEFKILTNKPVTLDVTGLFNPWIETPEQKNFFILKTNKLYFVNARLSKPPDLYYVQWKIDKGKSKRTLLSRNKRHISTFPLHPLKLKH